MQEAGHSGGTVGGTNHDRAAGVAAPPRFGLAAKLFAILLLLGAVAVLITGVLGYIRARDALEQRSSTSSRAARETKTHQVETYFRSIRNEMRLLAASKMVVDAMRGFRAAVDELDARPVPADLRQKVDGWYNTLNTCRWCAACSGPTRRSRRSCRSAPHRISCRTVHRRQSPSTGAAQPARRCRRRQRLQQAA